MDILNLIQNLDSVEDKLNNLFIKQVIELLLSENIQNIIESENKNILQVAENPEENSVQYVIPTIDGSVIFTLNNFIFINETNLAYMLEDCEYGFAPKTALLQAILKELIEFNNFKIPDDLPDEDSILIKNIKHLIGE